MLRTIIISVAVTLGGCISFPKTPDDFRATAAGVHEFEVDAPISEAYEVVAKNTVRCHEGDSSHMAMVNPTFFVNVSSAIRVNGRLSTDDASVEVYFSNISAQGLLQVIDLARTDPRKTKVSVYRLNDTKKWMTATQSVKQWFDGENSCFNLR